MLNLCVMDTCSIVFACQLDLGVDQMIDLLRQRFQINMPSYNVENELPGAKANYDADIVGKIDAFMQDRSHRVVEDAVYCQCLRLAERWYNKKGWTNQYRLMDEGDKRCLGTALYLSRREGRDVLLITDDFRLAEDEKTLAFFGEQGIGRIVTSLDLMLHFYSTIRRIGKEHVEAAFQDFFSVVRFREQKQVETRRKYQGLLEDRCRTGLCPPCETQCLSTPPTGSESAVSAPPPGAVI